MTGPEFRDKFRSGELTENDHPEVIRVSFLIPLAENQEWLRTRRMTRTGVTLTPCRRLWAHNPQSLCRSAPTPASGQHNLCTPAQRRRPRVAWKRRWTGVLLRTVDSNHCRRCCRAWTILGNHDPILIPVCHDERVEALHLALDTGDARSRTASLSSSSHRKWAS